MKEPVKNAVAQAVDKVMPQTIDPLAQANTALLQAQAEVKALRYTAQEITAQRDNAQNAAAEFGARLRIASEENEALHKALQTAEDALDSQRTAMHELRADLAMHVEAAAGLAAKERPRIAADSIEQPALVN